ncbi:MAG: hypothetical protein IT463_04610 [Planctomycetes bacterium]|nr:hypothetical protein [Planctomycetota bacterium]
MPHAPYQPAAGYPQQPMPYPGGPAYPQAPMYPNARPVKRGPSKVLGVIKILFGGGLALGFLAGMLHEGYQGAGVAGAMGFAMGVGLRWMATGGANLAGKRIPVLPSLGVILVGIVFGVAAGPSLSEGQWKAKEQETFDRLVSNESHWAWDYQYFWDIPGQFQRPEAKAHQLRAKVIAAFRDNKVAEVREAIAEVKRDHAGDPRFQMVLDAAAAGMGGLYDNALAKLSQPGKAADGAEFATDEELRKAFQVLLKDLAGAETSDVYVAFKNKTSLEAPDGHLEVYESYKDEPSVKLAFPDGKIPVIPQGEAFSPKFDAARRSTFVAASTEAFRQVFDASLLTLKPLGEDESREGKLVIEVESLVWRTTTYFNNYETRNSVQRSLGLLFGVAVDWQFRLFDRAGKQLYGKETRSVPANDISIIPTSGAPRWSVYSILMDSAYYNFSRETIGNFGLTPPAEQRAFAYQDWGVK